MKVTYEQLKALCSRYKNKLGFIDKKIYISKELKEWLLLEVKRQDLQATRALSVEGFEDLAKGHLMIKGWITDFLAKDVTVVHIDKVYMWEEEKNG